MLYFYINLIISGDDLKLMANKKSIVKIKTCVGKILLIRLIRYLLGLTSNESNLYWYNKYIFI